MMKALHAGVLAILVIAVGTGCKRNVVIKSSLAPQSAAITDLAPLRSALRNAASAQEIHYADPVNRYSYATEVSRLRFTPPPGVVLTIVEAGQKGWSGMARFGTTGPACVYYAGEAQPPSTPGGIRPERMGTVACDTAGQ